MPEIEFSDEEKDVLAVVAVLSDDECCEVFLWRWLRLLSINILTKEKE